MALTSLLDEALEAWQYTRAGVISEIRNLPDVSLSFRPAAHSSFIVVSRTSCRSDPNSRASSQIFHAPSRSRYHASSAARTSSAMRSGGRPSE